MKVGQRGPVSMEEKMEFDSVTFDEIQGIENVEKLRRLEQYMRDEGFPSTADAARVRLHQMGSRTFKDDEDHARREAEMELSKARQELGTWKNEIEGGKQQSKDNKKRKKLGREVPSIRDAGTDSGESNSCAIKEIVDEDVHASEIEWMAEREKEKGNELFKAGEYKECVEAYNKSIDLSPKAATLANRSAAKLKLKLYDSAIEDCTLALEQDPKYVKVLMRRAVARMELMQYEEAYEDIEAALVEAPGNKELEKMRDKVLRKMPQTVTQVHIEEVSDSDSDSDAEEEEEQRPQVEEINEDEIGKIVEITDEEDIGKVVDITEEEEERKAKGKAKAKEEEVGTKIAIEICSDSEDDSSDEDEEPRQTGNGPPRGNNTTATTMQAPAEPASKTSTSEDREESSEKAEDLKQKGNKAYSSGDLNAALHWYTESLKYGECSSVYSNRAQIHLKMRNFNAAISDCTSALDLDKGNVKAIYRRAMGRKEAGQITEAIGDFEQVKSSCPRRTDIAKEIEALRQRLEDKALEDKKKEEEEVVAKKKVTPTKATSVASVDAVSQQLPVPTSSIEFETNIRSIRKKPAQLAKYIYQIPAEKFGALFKKAFTSEILGCTIEGLLSGFDGKDGAMQFCLDVLGSFSQADRFSITSKMLSSKQKQCLKDLFTKLSDVTADEGLASLKAAYGVK